MGVVAGFHHIALNVSDFDKSMKFYLEGLGFKVYRQWTKGTKKIAMIEAGGVCLEVFGEAEPRTMVDVEAGNVIHVAFRVEDTEAAYARALEYGAEELTAPKYVEIQSDPILPVKLSFVKGPDGEEIEFFQPVEA